MTSLGIVEFKNLGAVDLVRLALEEAEQQGWSECPVPMRDVLGVIGERAVVVPTRRGEQPIGVLKALDSSEAHRFSLSRKYGRRHFPLHTDGAHRPDPPDAVLLEFQQSTAHSPTLLFTPRLVEISPVVEHALVQGVFDVARGKGGFLAHALSKQRLRFDPAVMTPRDDLAGAVRKFFEECAVNAFKYRSPGLGTTLIIDNRWTLHGRSAVPDGMSREADRAMIKWSQQ